MSEGARIMRFTDRENRLVAANRRGAGEGVEEKGKKNMANFKT